LKIARPNYSIRVPNGSLPDALADEPTVLAMRERVEAVKRLLPNANYHNPLTETLLGPS